LKTLVQLRNNSKISEQVWNEEPRDADDHGSAHCFISKPNLAAILAMPLLCSYFGDGITEAVKQEVTSVSGITPRQGT